MLILEQTKPDIDKNKLIKTLGGHSADSLSHSTGKTFESLTARIPDLMSPRIMYRMLKIASCKGSLELEGGLRFNSLKAAKIFHGCTDVCCFLATIGNNIDEEIIRLTSMKRSPDAYILDAMGSNAIENVVERFHSRVKKRMLSEGKAVTLRLSPGYCDWPLREQEKIFSLLDAQKIGVELCASSLMQPRKTISGIFGIMPPSADCNKAAYNPCSDCRKEHCIARRTEFIYDNTTIAAS